MYKLKETKAPIGYVSTNFEEQIDAHYQGQDIPSITYKAFIENEITEVEAVSYTHLLLKRSQSLEGC